MSAVNTDYFMTSERLGWRRWQTDDFPLALTIWGNPEVTRLFTAVPVTESQVKQRLNREIESFDSQGVQYWPIFRLQDGVNIGCAGLRLLFKDRLEFGVHLKPEFWGLGFATEAGRRVIRHAFDNHLCTSVFAGHHPQNRASRDMLLKLGFLGTTAQFYEPTGLVHPSYLMYRDVPACSTRSVLPDDFYALALVHSASIFDTFGGVLHEYVQARSLNHCEERWQSHIAQEENTTLVVQQGEQVVGFATVGPSPDEDVKGQATELKRIYLHPSLIGRGYGSELINWCESTLMDSSCRTMKLWVFEVNERARRVYERHGYSPDGKVKREYDASLLRYTKEIVADKQALTN